MGRFTRRDFVRYAPLLVALLPAAVTAEAAPTVSNAKNDKTTEAVGKPDVPQADIDLATNEPEVTNRAFLDISIDNQPAHRLILALYGTVAPKTVANFLALCEDGYANTKVYRIVPGLTVQLGDVLNNNGKSGRAATESGSLPAETFRISHSIPGIVSMVTKDGKVDSRFFVTTRAGDSKYLDGKYVAFGRVVEGMEFMNGIQKQGEGLVRKPVQVMASGILR